MAGLLVDLDGVIYQGGDVVEGAREAIDFLEREEIAHLFVSNTTSRPRDALVERLAGFDIEVSRERILTPPVAAASWLQAEGIRRIAAFVPEATMIEFADFEICEEVSADGAGAVVIGDLGEGWNFRRLNEAFLHLMQKPHPKLVALGMTRYWKAPDGLRLDTAPFVVALAHASGIQPVVLGKPARPFFEAALDWLGAGAERCWMIGDDIRADIGGAQDAGLRGILVRTGKYQGEDVTDEVEPWAVIDSIADLPGLWKRCIETDNGDGD